VETIGIVSNLEGQPYKKIKKLWASLERKYDCVAFEQYAHPHVSFQAARTSDIRQLKTDFQKLVSQIKPFKIEVGGLRHFDKKVIYLQIRKTQELVEIHRLVDHFLQTRCQDLFEYYTPENWIPHLTLAQKVPTVRNFEKAWHELTDSRLRFRQRLHNICMVKWYPDGKIKIAKRCEL
jgi:2'-5' RNA ligase